MKSVADILTGLQPVNRHIITLMMMTGERITNVISALTCNLYSSRIFIRGAGYKLPADFCKTLKDHAGKVYIFENARDPQRHRTRQSVYRDIRETCTDAEYMTPYQASRIGHAFAISFN